MKCFFDFSDKKRLLPRKFDTSLFASSMTSNAVRVFPASNVLPLFTGANEAKSVKKLRIDACELIQFLLIVIK